MGLKTSLRRTKVRAVSKYHELQLKALSKLNKWKGNSDINESKTFETKENFYSDFTKDDLPEECQSNSIKEEVTSGNELISEPKAEPERPDGSRIATIIVREGEIIEKIYITNENQRIYVKGSNL